MINKKKTIIRWACLLFWFGFIFYMSQKSGDDSTKQSNLVIDLLSFMGINLSDDFTTMTTFIVRKAAHFTEYFILFIFAYRVISIYVSSKMCAIYAIGLVFLYAGSDEFHQYFIPGRTAAFRDVLIDTSGGVFGAIIGCVIGKIRARTN